MWPVWCECTAASGTAENGKLPRQSASQCITDVTDSYRRGHQTALCSDVAKLRLSRMPLTRRGRPMSPCITRNSGRLIRLIHICIRSRTVPERFFRCPSRWSVTPAGLGSLVFGMPPAQRRSFSRSAIGRYDLSFCNRRFRARTRGHNCCKFGPVFSVRSLTSRKARMRDSVSSGVDLSLATDTKQLISRKSRVPVPQLKGWKVFTIRSDVSSDAFSAS